ncbi:bifunctional adenosylcobinamide kinase/adenosylcobinamide-phosphate guanylyltransferase [Paenibacillus senegalensis]|uniref:bifunctional adenosylcobinamide kinase/adenosylcobinamide-phosphate guanylyltransferase n=1 Tax=Paenibacillus senegalensis TaxID=1465766 RepID=UPI000288B485|nr:bifunctional adenosylcobinamide kinase/adenosylcobinamide-phosphate guanylyltransferase [Paenibacillus senegalensis]
MVIWITGGAKSGKSRFAEEYAGHLADMGIYVATTQQNRENDEEMRLKIAKHQEQRAAAGFAWTTAEVPYHLSDWLLNYKAKVERTETSPPPVVLVDCLTMWLSNWLLKFDFAGDDTEPQLDRKITELVDVIREYPYPLLLVSNEVGDGIVPEYPLGRQFRDAAGRMNQRIAAVSEQAFLVTAGIPVDLKKLAFRWD